MNKNLIPINLAGIDFLLDVDIDTDGNYVGLFNIQAWNKKDKKYYDISFEVEEFENFFKDQICEAVEEQKMNNAIFNAEMRYDAMKEEGLI